MRTVWFVLVGAVLLWGCGKNDEDQCAFRPDVGDIEVDFSIEQFEDSIVTISSKEQLVALLTRQPMMRDYILRRTAYPNDSVFINEIYKRVVNPHFDTLYFETKRVFPDVSELRSEFEEAFKHLKYYYPDFIPPRIQTMISGLDTDLFVSDSLIIVSLDFYLGKGARFRPDMYEYLLRQYEKENIVPSCMLIYGISERYNATNLQDRTVLADMIAYGKSYYFAKHMLPCVPDSVFTWYTEKEIIGARRNQDLIWARLIQDKVLFETSHMVKQRYLGERPKTLEVGEECPGRIGQWVGWQIINSYMNSHPEVTLPELMRNGDAQEIFKDSHYKPQRT